MSYTKFSYFRQYSSRIVGHDSGLRDYMLGIYNYMVIALSISGIVAFAFAKSGLAYYVFSTPFGMLFAFAPLVMSFYLAFKFKNMSYASVRNFFLLYACLMGISLSSIFLVYTSISIARAFFITAAMFGSMSIYGYSTSKDLTSIGSFMIMGAFGIMIAMLINLFLNSETMSFVISILSVIVFTVLTAYDTQKIKEIYYSLGSSNSETAKKVAVFGAFQLYMDFVIIFVHLLRLLDSRRD